jgi:hypothetical protein
MSTQRIKRHDTGQLFTSTLTLDGDPFDLTNCTVSFIMKTDDGVTQVKQTATVTDAGAGEVEYQPLAADVDTSGRYNVEWEVILPGGKILTFPNDGYNRLIILDDLG